MCQDEEEDTCMSSVKVALGVCQEIAVLVPVLVLCQVIVALCVCQDEEEDTCIVAFCVCQDEEEDTCM